MQKNLGQNAQPSLSQASLRKEITFFPSLHLAKPYPKATNVIHHFPTPGVNTLPSISSTPTFQPGHQPIAPQPSSNSSPATVPAPPPPTKPPDTTPPSPKSPPQPPTSPAPTHSSNPTTTRWARTSSPISAAKNSSTPASTSSPATNPSPRPRTRSSAPRPRTASSNPRRNGRRVFTAPRSPAGRPMIPPTRSRSSRSPRKRV